MALQVILDSDEFEISGFQGPQEVVVVDLKHQQQGSVDVVSESLEFMLSN